MQPEPADTGVLVGWTAAGMPFNVNTLPTCSNMYACDQLVLYHRSDSRLLTYVSLNALILIESLSKDHSYRLPIT